MTDFAPLTLIIDGNNLAHHLFSIPFGQKLTSDLDRKLVQHLSGWLEENRAVRLQIDLCLDYDPGNVRCPANIRLLCGHPYSADDIILHQVAACRWSGKPFLVISNDESLMDAVTDAGGSGLTVFEFVRLPGRDHPRFMAPRDLPRPTLSPQTSQRVNVTSTFAHAIQQAGQIKSNPTRPSRPGSHIRPQPFAAPAQEEIPVSPPGPIQSEIPWGPTYQLSLENWPVERGARFLLSSFCTRHRCIYYDLFEISDYNPLRPADLRVLADFLIESCGHEPDFTQHGCPLDRARLSLLQAPGETLTLKEMVASTGCKPDELRKKLKEKGVPWLKIDNSFQV